MTVGGVGVLQPTHESGAARPKRRRGREERFTGAVRARLEECELHGGNLVVAVSGGPDSTALLLALTELQGALGLRLHVAHLDHGLRPDSADDASFVRELAREMGHACTVERADVAAYRRERRLSPEAAAREVRYAFLARVARETAASAVAVAHTRDDQAETVLLHLVRGGGLAGLRGMSARSTYRGPGGPVALVRPLLEVTREETEAFCRSRGVTPRRDPTNLLATIPRNHLRLNVLPQLGQINPQVGAALARLARSAALDVDYMESQVDFVWGQGVRETDGGLLLDCDALNAHHRAVVQHLLRRAYVWVRGSEADLEQVHVEEMARLLLGPAGRRMTLPGGLTLEVGPQDAWLSAGRPYPCPLPPLEGEHVLPTSGEETVGGWRVRALEQSSPAVLDVGPFNAYLDQDVLGGTLAVRTRRRGDRFQPLGVRQDRGSGVHRGEATAKLQDFLVNQRVPRSWRDKVPLVVSPRGIAWVVGWRIAHWARVTPETRRALRLEFTPVEETPSSCVEEAP